ALIYAVVALVTHLKDRPEQPILSYIMSAFAVMTLIQIPIVTRRIARENRRKIAGGVPSSGSTESKSVGDTAPLLASFQNQMIAGSALIEGATFGLIVA